MTQDQCSTEDSKPLYAACCRIVRLQRACIQSGWQDAQPDRRKI